MGRPAKHDAASLLDAAVRVAAAEGLPGVTMVAVAREAGAPSGSVYHRFATRGALLAALWLRTVERFQGGYAACLDGADPVEGCVAAARHVVAWSRERPDEARLLLQGREAFSPGDWPDDEREREARQSAALDRTLRRAARRLGTGRGTLMRVIFVAVDVPYAAIRRNLESAGGGIPAGMEALVEETARAILTSK